MSAFDQLPEITRDQMACVFATLLLHDDGQEVNEEGVKKVIAATGIKVQPYWPSLFIKAIGDRDVSSLLSCGGGSGAAPAQVAPAQGNAPKAVAAKEEPKEEPQEESIGGLFD
jgi:large subunit ribosomal protein LP1